MTSNKRGFTLLEVMIALTIFAVIAATIMDTSSQSVDSVIYLEEKTLASWVAENTLTELRLSGELAVGNKKEQIKMANRSWQITTNITKTKLPEVYRVTVSVAKAEVKDNLISLIGVFSKR